VPGERRLRILAQLNAENTSGLGSKRLCEVSAEVTEATGAGIMLMAGDHPRGSLCTTDNVSALIEELQFTFGEGPCVDAYRNDMPVLEPDLVTPQTPRWIAFSAAAIEAGARAVFGFPLQVGTVRLGALNLYRNYSGPLSDDQLANALAMADVAAQAVLVLQGTAVKGELSIELERSANFQFVVHQATGMVAAQMGIAVGEALLRLRAHAIGNDRRLADVASDVVARTLRIDQRHGGRE
jgi:hypothetical protein